MKAIILQLLLINSVIVDIPLVNRQVAYYSQALGIPLEVKAKVVRDVICESRYSAWGIYSGNPMQSMYYAKCLQRYAVNKKDTINHAITWPFLLNGKMTGGGFATEKCFRKESYKTTSVSAWLSWNPNASMIALAHEALGHRLGAKHIEKACYMHPAATAYGYSGVCQETREEINRCK